MNEKKYYAVTAKCGHVGKGHYILITYGVIAENGKEAAKIARRIPRVKHDHKDAIRNVVEISEEEFLKLNDSNRMDPYLSCSSKQEQNEIDDFDSRLEIDNHNKKDEKNDRKERIIYLKKKRISYELSEYRDYLISISC